jgi:hypothetical protein
MLLWIINFVAQFFMVLYIIFIYYYKMFHVTVVNHTKKSNDIKIHQKNSFFLFWPCFTRFHLSIFLYLFIYLLIYMFWCPCEC